MNLAPRRLLALLDLALVPVVLGLCAGTVSGTPLPAGLEPAPLELGRLAIEAPESQGAGLERLAPAWEQLDRPEPEPEAPPAPAEPRSASGSPGIVIAVASHACIVQEPSGRQLALAVGDRWGEFEVAAIHLAPRAEGQALGGVVGTVELAVGGRRSELALVRE